MRELLPADQMQPAGRTRNGSSGAMQLMPVKQINVCTMKTHSSVSYTH